MERGQVKKEQTKKTSVIKRTVIVLFEIIALFLILLVVSVIAVNLYLESNKTKILSNLDFINDGTIIFKSAKISVFENFPHATISLDSVVIQDALFDNHKIDFLNLGNISAAATLDKIIDKKIEIRSVHLKDGAINLFTDENNFNNVKNLFSKESKEPKDKDDSSGFEALTDQLKVTLSNVDFHLTNAIKTSDIHALINELVVDLNTKEEKVVAVVEMDLKMKSLSFKKRKGSFVKDSNLSGKVNLEVKDGVLEFTPFQLLINEEQFLFSGRFDTTKKTMTELVLENPMTRLPQTMPLLPEPLRNKINRYQVLQPFYSKTTITGSFQKGEKTMVTVDFRLSENEAWIDDYKFKKISVEGIFINSLYDDLERQDDKKNARLIFSNLKTNHDGFLIKTDQLLINLEHKKEPQLITDAQISGRPADLSRWLKNDKFFFEKGSFQMNAKLKGPITKYNQIVIDSEVDLHLKNFSTFYKPSNTAFPFEELKLFKKSGDADFNIVSSTLENGNEFKIYGGLTNMISLLMEMSERSSSDVNLEAEKINWTDFVNLFGENGYLDSDQPKNDEDIKKSMKETLRGIHYSFQPSISMLVDTLQYYDKLELNNVKTGVHFENETTIILEKTSFNIGEGKVTMQAKLDISQPGRTPFEFEMKAKNISLQELLPPLNYLNIKILAGIDPLPKNMSIDIKHKGVIDDQIGLIPSTSKGEITFNVDKGRTLSGKITYAPARESVIEDAGVVELGEAIKTKVNLEGDPALFNKFFKTERFIFDKGSFKVDLDYEGDITDIGELLHNGNAKFILKNSEIYYTPTDVTFPIKNINLDLHQDNATFDITMRADTFQQKINIDGDITHISELVVGGTNNDIKTTVNLQSKKIRWENFIAVFSPQDTSNQEENKTINALKASVKGMLTDFNPDISVNVSNFHYYENIHLRDLKTGIHLKDSATMVLDKTSFMFHDGTMSLKGSLDLSKKNSSPFSGKFKTNQLDLAKTLKSFQYLGVSSLKKMERFSGEMTLDLDISGELADDGSGLVQQVTDGQLDFEFRNIVIKGYKPIDDLAAKILMKKRLKELKLSPFNSSVLIKGSEIFLPLTEVQSNALNIFIQGTYSFEDSTDLWVTIPLDNIKPKDLTVIPKKRGYANAKSKIHLQVKSDKEGNNDFKLRLFKRKYYKQRGILEQYKIDKKRYREIRRENKRKRKAAKD